MTDSARGVDPYASGMITERPNILRAPVALTAVGVLDSRRTGRGLQLIHPRTRCIRRDDIHELIVTTDHALPGGRVDTVHYIGFFAFQASAVLVEGDRLIIGGRPVAEIVGFDETHMPNHCNIVLRAPELVTGRDLGLRPGDRAEFDLWSEGS